MPKIRPQSPCVMAGIREGEAAGMAEHVRVHLEVEAGRGAGALDHLGEAGGGEGGAALAGKEERRLRAFALQFAERPHFVAGPGSCPFVGHCTGITGDFKARIYAFCNHDVVHQTCAQRPNVRHRDAR